MIKKKNLVGKIICLMSVVIISICLSIVFLKKNKVYAYSIPENMCPIGISYNPVKNKYLDLKYINDGSPIFEENWLSNEWDMANKIQINSTQSCSYYGADFSEIAKQFTDSLNLSADVSGGVDLFSATLSDNYSESNTIKYSEYASHYFYCFRSDIVRYTLSLRNYSSNLDELKNHLHPNYLNALDNLFNGRITYEEFFDMYGTHVIAKGIFGASFMVYYSAVSNYYDFDGIHKESITNSLNATISNAISLNSSAEFNLEKNCSFKNNQYSEFVIYKANGGNVFSGTSLSGLNYDFRNWAQSVSDSSAVLVGITSDGFIPLWRLLPNQYSSYESKLQNEFKNYAENYNANLANNFSKKIPQGIIFATQTRNGRYEISDKGPLEEDFDMIDMLQLGYGYDILKKYGYNKISVKITFTMWEKNDGYQQAFLFRTESDSFDSNIARCEFQFGGKEKKTEHRIVSFCFENYDINLFKTTLNNINEFALIVRYGATGTGEDTWFNESATIEVKIERNNRTANCYAKYV